VPTPPGRRIHVALLVAVLLTGASRTPAQGADELPVALKEGDWTVHVDPRSLRVTASVDGHGQVELSAGQGDLGPVEGLRCSDREAAWQFTEGGVCVLFRLDGDGLSAQFASEGPGRFTWPILRGEWPCRAYVLPLFEGSYVPADSAEWRDLLDRRLPASTMEGLSMPFWGVDCGDRSLTYIFTNPFDNELSLAGEGPGVGLKLTHHFKPNWATKEYGVLIRLGGPSPVEPARQYRRWLTERGEFVTLRQKMRQVPDVEKLLGAAHVYLWGSDLLSRHDVLDWQGLTGDISAHAEGRRLSPGKRVWDLLDAETREAVREASTMKRPYLYARRQLAAALSDVLERRDFYEQSAWQGIGLPAEATKLLREGIAGLSDVRLRRLNCLLLAAAFPGRLAPVDRWGDGLSVKMMERFAEADMDRLWLGLSDWDGAFNHPQAVRKASDLGYLIGTYDSYHSIHHPQEADSWPTAQFDLDLYETGPIVRADGTKKPGFQKKGYALSPIAASPYVEARVNRLMAAFPEPLNSWFIDCDAYGELFDDYSELHAATQRDDMQARLDRMAWISDMHGLVIGSEGGAAYSVPTIHFAHGMMTPVFGWADADLRSNKESEFYLGAWWPPDAPAVFVKQVPLKPLYRTLCYDPRFRLPLYEMVFHDSVVATHHWGSASLKFGDQVDTVELLELLYNVPPLYHMNLEEFEKHRDRIKAHQAFFSPLHRELGLLPMTDFEWLTPDRMVQRTVFGDGTEMVANFTGDGFVYGGAIIPPRSVLAKQPSPGRTGIYTPAPAGS